MLPILLYYCCVSSSLNINDNDVDFKQSRLHYDIGAECDYSGKSYRDIQPIWTSLVEC